MPMQIGLDELLSMVMARMEGLTMEMENQRTRFNIMFRVLYKKGLFAEADVLESVREEHRILHELGMLKEMPDEKALKEVADGLMLWVKGDVKAIQRSLEEYDQRVKDAMSQQQKPKIDVASAAVLNELDRMNPGAGKKLIL